MMETRNLFIARCPIRKEFPVWMFVLTDLSITHGLFLYNENSTGAQILYGRICGSTVALLLKEAWLHRNIEIDISILKLVPADENAYRAVNHLFREMRAPDSTTFMHRGLCHLEQAKLITPRSLELCTRMIKPNHPVISRDPQSLDPSAELLEDSQPSAAILMAFLRSPVLGPSAAHPPTEFPSRPPSSLRSQRQVSSAKSSPSGPGKPSPCSLLRSDVMPGACTLVRRTRACKPESSKH